jgi:transcriptional regulator with GAF, ATPase, and Fis domain
LRGAPDVTEFDLVSTGSAPVTRHRDSTFSPDSVVVGRSRRMRAVFDFLRVIEGSESNVLIIGETGTGKEVVARLIHHRSERAARTVLSRSGAPSSLNR